MHPAASLDPLGLTAREFILAARASGVREPQAIDAYRRVYRDGVAEAPPARARIAPVVRRLEEPTPEGLSIKFVQRLPGRERVTPSGDNAGMPYLDIESVIIPMVGRRAARSHTLCVSSQVGCAMGCVFCETAQMGLVRSLTPGEIVGQWWSATHVERARVKNIVFMGMGEPLENLDNVLGAIEILTDHNGAGVPMANIQVSTSGRPEAIRRLAASMRRPGWHKLGLAVSINAPNDEIRSRLMPINRASPMRELREALLDVPHLGTHKKICFAYVLIPGQNDDLAHADELAAYLEPFTARSGTDGRTRGMVNLIPYNPRRGSPWEAPTPERVAAFHDRLRARGVYVKLRRTKGRDSMAACGQLGTEEIRKRRFVGLRVEHGARAEA